MDKKLKTRLFGFSRKDTMDYIQDYQESCGEKLAHLELEIAETKAENEKLKDENSKLAEEIRELSDNLSKTLLQLDEERKKSDENINVKNRVGEIFIDAKQRADSIIYEANKQAENIKTTAIEQAATTVSDIDSTYLQLEQLRSNMKTVFNDFCSRVDSINCILKSAKQNIKSETDGIFTEKKNNK